MRIYKELPHGGTVMGMSHEEAKKPRKDRRYDVRWQRIFRNGNGIAYWDIF